MLFFNKRVSKKVHLSNYKNLKQTSKLNSGLNIQTASDPPISVFLRPLSKKNSVSSHIASFNSSCKASDNLLPKIKASKIESFNGIITCKNSNIIKKSDKLPGATMKH